MSGKDIGAKQFSEQYQHIGQQAKAAGYDSSQEYLSAPYAWMTQEGRDAREAGGDVALKYQKPEYRPTEWEAWVGGMSDSGYQMKDIYDATAYYSSELGSKVRELGSKQYGRGKEYYMDPRNDRTTFEVNEMGTTKRKGSVARTANPFSSRYVQYMERHEGGPEKLRAIQEQWTEERAKIASGEGIWSPEEREEQWAKIEQQHKDQVLPWKTEGFQEVYQAEYGDMKEHTVAQGRREGNLQKPGKRAWYERHHGMLKGGLMYEKLMKEWKTGVKGNVYSKGISIPKSASVGDRFARLGVTMSPERRDLYGQNPTGKEDFRYDPDDYTWGVVGDTWGEAGHDIMGRKKKTSLALQDDIDDPYTYSGDGG
jgi:hypothetical protein